MVERLQEISIHAPRVGSDGGMVEGGVLYLIISIHAPRVGSDVRKHNADSRGLDFNPRSPCGERLVLTRVIRS